MSSALAVQSNRHLISRLTHSTATVGTSSGEAVAANTSRTYLILINDSANTIYLKLNDTAVMNEGIRLAANGGSYEMSVRNGNLDDRAINAIAGSSSTLLITESN